MPRPLRGVGNESEPPGSFSLCSPNFCLFMTIEKALKLSILHSRNDAELQKENQSNSEHTVCSCF